MTISDVREFFNLGDDINFYYEKQKGDNGNYSLYVSYPNGSMRYLLLKDLPCIIHDKEDLSSIVDKATLDGKGDAWYETLPMCSFHVNSDGDAISLTEPRLVKTVMTL